LRTPHLCDPPPNSRFGITKYLSMYNAPVANICRRETVAAPWAFSSTETTGQDVKEHGMWALLCLKSCRSLKTFLYHPLLHFDTGQGEQLLVGPPEKSSAALVESKDLKHPTKTLEKWCQNITRKFCIICKFHTSCLRLCTVVFRGKTCEHINMYRFYSKTRCDYDLMPHRSPCIRTMSGIFF